MPECPRCQQSVDSQAIACPACGTLLKAYGHPGISLHQATDGAALCESCLYHQDDTCNFPKRPYARQCTLYQPLAPAADALRSDRPSPASGAKGLFQGDRVQSWIQEHSRALLWIGLAVVSILVVLR